MVFREPEVTTRAEVGRRRRLLLPPLPPGWRIAGLSSRLRLWIGASVAAEWDRGRFFLWIPVCFGAGILTYFALPREPMALALGLLAAGLVGLAVLLRRRPIGFPIAVAAIAVASGLLVTKLRTDHVAAPVLAAERSVEVSGFVVKRDRSGRNGARLMLLVRSISGVSAEALPRYVRVTLRAGAEQVRYGNAIKLRARLRPPDGPPLPGGYDFARTSFYQGIGGSGFALGRASPAELGPAPVEVRLMKPLAELRRAIGERIEQALPGEHGRVAVALIVGDQGGISEDTLADLRTSGLAHILSISGLHMVLVAGTAFWVLRALLALIPAIALRYPIKKWSAAFALTVATIYLGLSGAEVPTQRSYVMLAIMLLAVMVGRRAISLRNVALAAIAVLAIAPESLLSASFQMSFAAAAALVSAFEAMRGAGDSLKERGPPTLLGRLWRSGAAMFLTSLVAGLATTPFAAFHFQRLAPLSILANLLAMPAVSFLVMPFAFLAVLLIPLGLEPLALQVMALGLDAVKLVAAWVADLSEGFGGVPMAPSSALLLIVAGFLWLILWGERWRLLGLAPIVAGLLVAAFVVRPDLLISPDGASVAARGPDGRLRVVGGPSSGFTVDNWLRADADSRRARDPTLLQGTGCDPQGCLLPLASGDKRVALVRDVKAFGEDCLRAAIVVSALKAPSWCGEHATVIDGPTLARSGAQAIYLDEESGAPRRVATAYPEIRRPFMPPLRSQ